MHHTLDVTTVKRDSPLPCTPSPASSRAKKASSRQGLDKVFHNAKNRALSAIFSKNSEQETASKTKVKMRDLKNSTQKNSSVASPLVSSLISPRTVPDYPEPPSTSIFHRTVFCFSKKNVTMKNNSSHQLPNSAR